MWAALKVPAVVMKSIGHYTKELISQVMKVLCQEVAESDSQFGMFAVAAGGWRWNAGRPVRGLSHLYKVVRA